MNILIIDTLVIGEIHIRGNSFYEPLSRIENCNTFFIKDIDSSNNFIIESKLDSNNIFNIKFDLIIAHVNDYFGYDNVQYKNLNAHVKIFYGGDKYHNNVKKVNNEGYLINRQIYTDGFITEQESNEIIEFVRNNCPVTKTPKLLCAFDPELNNLFDGFFEARRNNNLESEKSYKSKLKEYANKQR